MSNIQVTHDVSLNNARSESCIVINPNNPQQIVAASKKFKNIQNYDFTLATSYSTDGGHSWYDSADVPILPEWCCLTDPTLAWDDAGNVFLVGLGGKNPPRYDCVGIAIYKSTDGGKTWSNPNLIHEADGDDKQWAAGDGNPASPYHGRVYAVWDDVSNGSDMRFARTLDHGSTWIGTGANPPGSVLATDSFSPEINVSADGTICIVWIAGNEIKMIVSTDGGDSFHPVVSPAKGVTTLYSLQEIDGWPVFPGGSFRVMTLPSACMYGQTIVVAWADYREGVSRIYYNISINGGASWTMASGQPLLTRAISGNFQHFHPQVISDPNGIIACAFYEFGPKPTTNLIDVIIAQSFDGGATFHDFTVTDQPWDPAVDAPWVHGDPNVTFIGEYFGLDASFKGFYPLWTDTRTGIQELWNSIVPEKKCAFLIERSTLGQDEIDARRSQPGGAVVQEAFRVIVDGFTAAELGITGQGSKIDVQSPIDGLTINCEGNTSDTGDYGPEYQRFTFTYDIDFGPKDDAFNFAEETKLVTLNVMIKSISSSAQIELIKQPNPFILHGDPYWLSIDLRVFVVREGETRFGGTCNNASEAPRFIQKVMEALTNGHGAVGTEKFSDLPQDESASLYVYPKDNQGSLVFNFALAKVHYIGQIGAQNVRVFFRLFQAQTTSTAFEHSIYRRSPDLNPDGQPIPVAGIQGDEYVTIPCFAADRIDSTIYSMDRQTDPKNVQDFTAIGGPEVDRFYGCWLDINQPFKPNGDDNNVLPIKLATNIDGPFTDTDSDRQPRPIEQAIIRNPHQCLVAEIAFDPIAIPPGKDPSNWDKLAQRNIAWSDIPNPGVDGSRRALSTFEIRPTPTGLPFRQTPDELMIDWGNTPDGSIASIYLPAVNVDDILAMAARMYTTHRLASTDNHTLHCRVGGITYIPIPCGMGINYAGLLSVDLPSTVRNGQVFNIAVRQVTNAFGEWPIPERKWFTKGATQEAVPPVQQNIQWRRVLGAFQLTVPIHTKEVLLEPEERLLSVLRWIQEAIQPENRWFLVFNRYVAQVAGRVQGLGGDPTLIGPSPSGEWQGGASGRCRLWEMINAVVLAALIAVLGTISGVAVMAMAVLLVVAAYLWWTQCQPRLCSLLRVLIVGAGIGALILVLLMLLGVSSPQLVIVLAAAMVLEAIAGVVGLTRHCF